MNQPVESAAYRLDGAPHKLWHRILGLIEQDLDERRRRKLFVEVRGESGSYEKEIGDLSAEERRNLHPVLREHVVEQLLDRHLAEQGRVDLLERRRPYTKEIQDLTPEDLPALIEADRQRAEEEHQKRRERAEFVREVQEDLERFFAAELAETGGATMR